MPEEAGNEALKTIAKGAGIAFIGIIASKFFTYLFRIFVARYFGPGDYGLFSIGIAVLSFFMVFALLGLQTGVIRYIAHYRAKGDDNRVRGVITSSIKMVLPTSVVMCILMMILSPYLAVNVFSKPGLAGILLVLSISIPFSVMITILASVFVGFKQNKYQVFSEQISVNLAKLVLVILFGILAFGIVGIAWSWTIAMVLAFFLSLYFLRKVYPDLRAKVASIPMKRELFSYSLPLLLVASMGFLIMWTDTLMLGIFRTASDVGIYNAAMPTGLLLFIFPNAIAALFLPIITELYARKKMKELKRIYKTVTRWAFYINFPMFLLMVFFSGQILNLIFGPEYVAGYGVLIIISTGFMFRKSVMAVQMLQMLKKTRYIFLISASSAILNIILNLLLIPTYGIIGAATASMITYIISISMLLTFFYRFGRINPFSKSMLKSVFAGLLAIAVIYLVGHALFTVFTIYVLAGLFIAFILLYGLILLLIKGLGREDIEIMNVIEKKSGLKLNFLKRIFKKFV